MHEILVENNADCVVSAPPPSDEELSFLKDVAHHKMLILRDTPAYRHIAYRNPEDSECHFEILTWPGTLCYSGDMGTYVFSRTTDMFEFFRQPRLRATMQNRPLQLDYRYWAEKVQASCRDGIKRFDVEKFKRNVELMMQYYAFPAEAREACRADVFDEADLGSKALAEKALFDFEYLHEEGGKKYNYNFSNIDELDCESYTHSFLWCCHAISWAIGLYDKAAKEKKEASTVPNLNKRKRVFIRITDPTQDN